MTHRVLFCFVLFSDRCSGVVPGSGAGLGSGAGAGRLCPDPTSGLVLSASNTCLNLFLCVSFCQAPVHSLCSHAAHRLQTPNVLLKASWRWVWLLMNGGPPSRYDVRGLVCVFTASSDDVSASLWCWHGQGSAAGGTEQRKRFTDDPCVWVFHDIPLPGIEDTDKVPVSDADVTLVQKCLANGARTGNPQPEATLAPASARIMALGAEGLDAFESPVPSPQVPYRSAYFHVSSKARSSSSVDFALRTKCVCCVFYGHVVPLTQSCLFLLRIGGRHVIHRRGREDKNAVSTSSDCLFGDDTLATLPASGSDKGQYQVYAELAGFLEAQMKVSGVVHKFCYITLSNIVTTLVFYGDVIELGGQTIYRFAQLEPPDPACSSMGFTKESGITDAASLVTKAKLEKHVWLSRQVSRLAAQDTPFDLPRTPPGTTVPVPSPLSVGGDDDEYDWAKEDLPPIPLIDLHLSHSSRCVPPTRRTFRHSWQPIRPPAPLTEVNVALHNAMNL